MNGPGGPIGEPGQGQDQPILPELRPELSVQRGSNSRDSGIGWMIYDPVQHRHFQIDQSLYELLSVWPECRTVDELVALAGERFDAHVDLEQVGAFVQFLESNHLLANPMQGGWRHYANEANRQAEGKGGLTSLMHNYLFFRLPLFRPQRFLLATLPLMSPFYSRWFAILVVLLGATGIYLVSRQWDAFLSTTDFFFTWEGLISFGVALIIVKVAHELGHAYTAVRYGCYVPTVGVAFMLLTPLLYTDVSDAWKLRNRRQRLSIDSAGIVVELSIACIATFLWAFLPDGPIRSVAFMLATAGWIMSLAINLNPFMRFDGYYLFAELIGIENLQSRAFALGRWRLREVLFGLGHQCPEALSSRMVHTLVFWAWATWIYRLLLFIGIALLVYTYCFKVLGILLFVLEIVFLIAHPIFKELSEWFAMRKEIAASRRTVATAVVAACIVVISIVPWSTSVTVPAVIQLSETQPVHSKRPALIEQVHVAPGAKVEVGDPLFTLRSDDIINQAQRVQTELRLIRLRLGRINVDDIDREDALILQRKLHALQTKRAGLLKERSQLVLRAPIAGRVLELEPAFHPGRWIKPSDRLALIGRPAKLEAAGYVHEDDIWRLAQGAGGSFIPDTPMAAKTTIRLREIAVAGAPEIKMPSLASVYGGPIPVERDDTGKLVPVKGQYLTTLEIVQPLIFQGTKLRGIAHIDGLPESLLAKFWRRTLNVLVRESGA